MNTIVKAAAVQISPVLYSRQGTVEKVVKKIRELGKQGVQFATFPETVVPYYPYFSFVQPAFAMGMFLIPLAQLLAPHREIARLHQFAPNPLNAVVFRDNGAVAAVVDIRARQVRRIDPRGDANRAGEFKSARVRNGEAAGGSTVEAERLRHHSGNESRAGRGIAIVRADKLLVIAVTRPPTHEALRWRDARIRIDCDRHVVTRREL